MLNLVSARHISASYLLLVCGYLCELDAVINGEIRMGCHLIVNSYLHVNFVSKP